MLVTSNQMKQGLGQIINGSWLMALDLNLYLCNVQINYARCEEISSCAFCSIRAQCKETKYGK